MQMSWLPMLAGIAGLGLAFAVESISPAAAEFAQVLPMLGFAVGGLVSYLRWGRGSTLRLRDDLLTIGQVQAPANQLDPRVDKYVYRSQSRFAAGKYWLPSLVVKLGSTEVAIVRRAGGGSAGERPTSPRPAWELEPGDWDALARGLGVDDR